MIDMQEFKYRLYLIRGQLSVLAILLLLVAVVYVVTGRNASDSSQEETVPLAEQIRTGSAPIPAYTSSTQVKLENNKGFQALVSYAAGGFEPAKLTIKKGDTVRFTNNSSNNVWIAANGTNVQIYPRTRAVCGSSDLDSCEPFEPMDFWEFTFDVAGEWEVVNNLDKSKSGVIQVR